MHRERFASGGYIPAGTLPTFTGPEQVHTRAQVDRIGADVVRVLHDHAERIIDDPEDPAVARGLFIVFEGGEGTGKTTQAARLVDDLTQAGHTVTATREPGGTNLGGQLRDLLLRDDDNPMPAQAETLLYLADRAIHVAHVIRPALARGEVVVCDRYADSTAVYQGWARKLDSFRIEEMSRWATVGLRPDLVLVLDIDPAVGLARAGRRGPADRFEQEDITFHEHVRAGYRHLAEQRWRNAEDGTAYVLINADQPVDDVAGDVRHAVEVLLLDRARAGAL